MGMSDAKRCKSCGNPVEQDQAKDGACPWCLAAFTFSPERVGNPATAAKDAPTRFGKYVRTEKLGAGGMGEVWKALDTELNRWVALKFLKDDDPSSTVRFQREARTAAGLSHTGIASIHEVGEVEGRHFIAMQYIQGRTMATFPKKDRRLLVRLFKDAARALDHAHRHGVIHRDLKPDNLMVEEREDGWHVVILDFGLARAIEGGEKLSKSGEVYGTAAYMSPEQAKGDDLDERADVYSLGATMYEVLTGRPPFRGANLLELLRKVGAEEPPKPRKINPRIHRDLETIILKCLEKDRERRYANARELAEDLERFLGSDPILARPPSTLYRLKLTLEKRKGVAITAAAGLIGIVVVAILISGGHDRQKESRDLAGTKVDVARLKIDQIDHLMKAEEDRTREIDLLASAVRAELNEALKICPDHEEACFEMGRMLAMTDYGSEALDYFGRAIKLAPRQAKAYLARATQNLDYYERLRHSQGGTRVRGESEKSKRVLARILEDLKKIRSITTEVPQLKYADGMLSFAQGNFRLASDQLKEYVNLAPADVDGWVWLGHAQGHADAYDDAVKSLTRALRLRPRMPWALVLRGNAYYDLDRYDESIADHTRALEMNPNDAVALMNRGNARTLNGAYDEAIADYNRAIDLNPGFANAYSSRGSAKAKKDLHDEALADFDKAIQLDPNEANVYYNRGNSKRRKGLEDDAIADYTKSLDLNPKDHKAWAARGDAKNAKGLYEEALLDYAQSIALNPKYPISYYNRGVVKRGRGLVEEAIADFDRAIALDPKFVAAWGSRAGCKKLLWRLDEAIADNEMCIKLEPGMSHHYVNRGVVKAAMGLVEDALADYSKAIDLDPKDDLAWMNRGVGKFDLGQLDDALADLSKSIEVRGPDLLHCYNNRAAVLQQMGRTDDSIADCKKALALDPKSSEAYINLGVAKRSRGLLDEAMADYTKAIDLDPKSANAHMNRGNVRDELGLWNESIKDFEKALALAPPRWKFRTQVEESIQAQEFKPVFREARGLHRVKKHREAIEKYLPIVAKIPKSRYGYMAAFNIACAYALMGEKAQALDWMEKAFDLGWQDYAHAQRDTDLDSLRDDERFRKLMERVMERTQESQKLRKPPN